MKKLILSLAIAGSMIIASTACNSTKNMSGSSDSTMVDTTMKRIDSAKIDTTMKMLPDTTMKPVQ